MANPSKDLEGTSNSTKEKRSEKKTALIPAMSLDEFFKEYEVPPINEDDEEDEETDEDQEKGPTKEKVVKFSRFLGTFARDIKDVTLLYTNWQAVPDENKTKMLAYAKAIAKKNTENRSKQKCNQRMGPVNFEIVRAELRAKKENNEEPSQAEMFVATRTNQKGETLHSSTQEMIVSYLK
ncbi:hypothetical protein PIB30_079121 [Stylosanthes scabra]|uniref:Uncharacterized protein n=1 Tax=Stylosanthes scabra TaxID=79078 RepID=A0ABU6SRF9_9FABA|nr:hypothetical protein [Stylosanthes scabra]